VAEQHNETQSDDGGRANDGGSGDRRSRHRVGDDQKSGHGSQSALSKLKMLERKRAAMKPGDTDDDE
jgi:hypothetical protein